MEGGSPALSPCVNRGEGHSQTMTNKLAGSCHAAPPQLTQDVAPSTRASLPLLLGCPEASHRPGLEQARPEGRCHCSCSSSGCSPSVSVPADPLLLSQTLEPVFSPHP